MPENCDRFQVDINHSSQKHNHNWVVFTYIAYKLWFPALVFVIKTGTVDAFASF